jgi:hypothetical protein
VQRQQQHLPLHSGLAQQAPVRLLAVPLVHLALVVPAVQLPPLLPQLPRLAAVHLGLPELAAAQHSVAVRSGLQAVPAVRQQVAAALLQAVCLAAPLLVVQAAQVLAAAAHLARWVPAAAAEPQVQRHCLGPAVQQVLRQCLAVQAAALVVLAVPLERCYLVQAAAQQHLVHRCSVPAHPLLLPARHLVRLPHQQQQAVCLVEPAMQQARQPLARLQHSMQQQHRLLRLVRQPQLPAAHSAPLLLPARQRLAHRAAQQLLARQPVPLHLGHLAVQLVLVLVCLGALVALYLLGSSSSSNPLRVLHLHRLVLPLVNLRSLLLRLAKLLHSGSSSSSQQAHLCSSLPLARQQRRLRHSARQRGSGRQQHQRHLLGRPVHLVLLLAARLVEALLPLLLLQARPLGQVAAALQPLLRLKQTLGLVR